MIKFNLRERYKNAKQVDFLYDLKNYKKLKMSIIMPYAVMLSPIYVIWVLYFAYWTFGINDGFLGYLNTFPFWLLFLGIILFCVIDIRNIFIYCYDNKPNPLKWLKKNTLPYLEVVFLALMFIWILIAGFANPDPMRVFSITNPAKGYMQEGILFYFAYALVFVFALKLQDRNAQDRILIAFLISSVFAGLTTIVDPAGTFLLATHNNTGWAFGFVNSNHYGYFLTLSCIASALLSLTHKSSGIRLFSGLTFLLNVVILMFNDTLGSMIAVLAVLVLLPIVYSIRNRKFNWRYLVPLGVFIAVSFILAPLGQYAPRSTYRGLAEQLVGLVKDFFTVASEPLSEEATHAGTDRWSLWLKSFEVIKENPIFGNGDVFFKPHNEYLQHAGNFGIPCLLFYLVALVIIMIKSIKYLRHLSDITLTLLLSTLCYLISALFGNTMPHTMPFFIVFLAFLIRALNTDIKEYKDSKAKSNTNITNIEVKVNSVEE